MGRFRNPLRDPKKEAELLTSSASSVCLAAAFVVEDDRAWQMFAEYLRGHDGKPVGNDERRAMDLAISLMDNVRMATCRQWGFAPGIKYTRKFR